MICYFSSQISNIIYWQSVFLAMHFWMCFIDIIMTYVAFKAIQLFIESKFSLCFNRKLVDRKQQLIFKFIRKYFPWVIWIFRTLYLSKYKCFNKLTMFSLDPYAHQLIPYFSLSHGLFHQSRFIWKLNHVLREFRRHIFPKWDPCHRQHQHTCQLKANQEVWGHKDWCTVSKTCVHKGIPTMCFSMFVMPSHLVLGIPQNILKWAVLASPTNWSERNNYNKVL